MRPLLVVATPGEAQLLRGLGVSLRVSGIGAVNAALATAEAVREEHPDLVVSVGIGGAYPSSGLTFGDVAFSSEMIYATLGAMGGEDGQEFLDLAALGFELLDGLHNRLPAWEGAPEWTRRAQHVLAEAGARAACGPLLTVDTVTGSAVVASSLERRFPGALVEGMEGSAVAHAARRLGVPALEIRSVSNPVGPRDRSAWRIPEALSSLTLALQAVLRN